MPLISVDASLSPVISSGKVATDPTFCLVPLLSYDQIVVIPGLFRQNLPQTINIDIDRPLRV